MSKLLSLMRRTTRSIPIAAIRVLAPILAPVIRYMAWTGLGTDACLQYKCLPMPVHFYSPVPDIEDLKSRRVWQRRSELEGIDFRTENQLSFLSQIGRQFGNECKWSFNQTPDPYEFYINNTNFSYGCAAALHSILRYLKPKHVVEIGSGNSSLIISSALSLNDKGTNAIAEYTIIDPYPRSIIEEGLPSLTRLIKKRVEVVPVDFFGNLGENDVLFVDSGHTVRIGGDVNYLILEVLPRLQSGVFIHFHDIGLPYEYPKEYATNAQFRMFWTEAYLLQAFLAFNSNFNVVLAMAYLMKEYPEEFQTAFPFYNPAIHKSLSSSFWICRC